MYNFFLLRLTIGIFIMIILILEEYVLRTQIQSQNRLYNQIM